VGEGGGRSKTIDDKNTKTVQIIPLNIFPSVKSSKEYLEYNTEKGKYMVK